MAKPKILIGVPTMSSMHTMLVCNILIWMAQAFKSGKYDIQFYPTFSVAPVENARTEIVQNFLEGDCTHLFFIDSDTIPPINALDKLLAADKEFISAITPIIQHDPKRSHSDSSGFYKQWNAVTYADVHLKEPYCGTIKVKAVGGSCMLLKRSVFEKIQPPYFRYVHEDESGRVVNVGEDIYFSLKALGAGIDIYADTSIVCSHYKSIPW